jgi:hypothetical protein
MAAGKYAKLIKIEPLEKSPHAVVTAQMIRYKGKEYADAPLTFAITYITQPLLMIKEPHKHDFDQFLCFMGGDPTNFKDFGAEVEFWMGEEREKYIINTTSTIYVPKGLLHGPMNYKRVDKPIIFLDIVMTSSYARVPTSQ